MNIHDNFLLVVITDYKRWLDERISAERKASRQNFFQTLSIFLSSFFLFAFFYCSKCLFSYFHSPGGFWFAFSFSFSLSLSLFLFLFFSFSFSLFHHQQWTLAKSCKLVLQTAKCLKKDFERLALTSPAIRVIIKTDRVMDVPKGSCTHYLMCSR